MEFDVNIYVYKSNHDRDVKFKLLFDSTIHMIQLVVEELRNVQTNMITRV